MLRPLKFFLMLSLEIPLFMTCFSHLVNCLPINEKFTLSIVLIASLLIGMIKFERYFLPYMLELACIGYAEML